MITNFQSQLVSKPVSSERIQNANRRSVDLQRKPGAQPSISDVQAPQRAILPSVTAPFSNQNLVYGAP